MAARGTESKENVTKKILENFTGSFIFGKEIRIPMVENGERVEIKVTLTCAKTNVGTDELTDNAVVFAETAGSQVTTAPIKEITEEEKQNVANLIERLGL